MIHFNFCISESTVNLLHLGSQYGAIWEECDCMVSYTQLKSISAILLAVGNLFYSLSLP